MCSGYFTDKPEVIFRGDHPQLFFGQPVWLHQAAVCLKCHHVLVTSTPQVHLECSPEKMYCITTTTTTTQSGVRRANNQGDAALDNRGGNGRNSQSRKKQFFPDSNSSQQECYICCNHLHVPEGTAKLKRSRFPTLFSSQPEDVGLRDVCQSCYVQLNQRRALFIKNDIREHCRDYAAHIKTWTGNDKFLALDSSVSTCFVCEKVLPSISSTNLVHRRSFPQIFSNFPSSIVSLSVCAGCMEKLQQVHMEFAADNFNYWGHINQWREKKGLPPFSCYC